MSRVHFAFHVLNWQKTDQIPMSRDRCQIQIDTVNNVTLYLMHQCTLIPTFVRKKVHELTERFTHWV